MEGEQAGLSEAAAADDQSKAAAKIQARRRGNAQRLKDGTAKFAATRIQASIRGKSARRALAKGIFALFNMFNGWGAPVRGSVTAEEIARLSPPDATLIERVRDRWLVAMASVEGPLIVIAVILTTGFISAIVSVVVIFVWLNEWDTGYHWREHIRVDACREEQYNQSWIVEHGTASLPPRVDHPSVPTMWGWTTQGLVGGKYVATHCTHEQLWFEICIKYLSYYFGYINLLPVPWTFSTMANSFFPRKEAVGKTGVDFYGRPTRSLWFHLPRHSRKTIATLNTVALLLQVPDCLFHLLIFHTYARQSHTRYPDPGAHGGQCVTRIAGSLHGVHDAGTSSSRFGPAT